MNPEERSGGVPPTPAPEPHPSLAGLREALCAFPSRDLREALLFATFATRCVRGVPPGLARSVSDEVADPRLCGALEAAERWLSLPSPTAALLDASDAAIRAAAEAGGPNPRVDVGAQAAAWAVACAVASTAYAATIGADGEGPADPVLIPEEQGSDASRYALLAATCAVQSAGAGHDAATIQFQRDLILEVWSPSQGWGGNADEGRVEG